LVRVTIEKSNGERHEIDAAPGMSLMRVVVENNIGGVVAECGGTAACGTCHCFVIEDGGVPFAAPTAQEKDILEFVAEPAQDNSRLSCQLIVPAQADTIVIRLPAIQL
jgi:2Fe-2S ferredoxin